MVLGPRVQFAAGNDIATEAGIAFGGGERKASAFAFATLFKCMWALAYSSDASSVSPGNLCDSQARKDLVWRRPQAPSALLLFAVLECSLEF